MSTPHRRRTRPKAVLIEHRPSGAQLRALLEANASLPPTERPRTRGDCVGGERPCPWMGCRFSLLLDVTPSGSIKINHPDGLNGDSCSLDVADRGAASLDAIGLLMNSSRQRIQQIEKRAVRKLKRKGSL